MSVNIKQNGSLTPIAGMDDQINDSTASSTTTYSSNKINTLLGGKADTSSLATVATSGSYNDLSNKPTIDYYLDQTATTSTTDPTTYTFTDAKITADSAIDPYADIFGVYPSSVVASAGTCTVTFPKQDTAQSMTCRIYIK